MVVGVFSGAADSCSGFEIRGERLGTTGAEILWRSARVVDPRYVCLDMATEMWRFAVVPRTDGAVTFRKTRDRVVRRF